MLLRTPVLSVGKGGPVSARPIVDTCWCSGMPDPISRNYRTTRNNHQVAYRENGVYVRVYFIWEIRYHPDLGKSYWPYQHDLDIYPCQRPIDPTALSSRNAHYVDPGGTALQCSLCKTGASEAPSLDGLLERIVTAKTRFRR